MAITDIRGAQVDASDPPISTSPNPGLAIKAPVAVATTGSNINLSGVQVVDGVTVGNNAERVLVKDQTDQTTNGLYNAATGPWTRTIDANNNSQFSQGMLVAVTQGTALANTLFALGSANPVTLGTTALTFEPQSMGLTLPFSVAKGGTGGITQAAAQISLGLRERLTANRTYYVRTVPVNVTITIATPGVVTWANHDLAANAPVVFNTSGALPSGLATGVIYYVVGASITANTFEVSLAPNGAAVNTSGTQSGTQTAQTGNDSNNGLSQTAAGAFLTVQHLVATICQAIDLNGSSVAGQLAHGYYLENVVLAPYMGRGSTGHTSPTIQGDAANPGAVVIQAASGAAISGTETGSFEWVLENINVSSPSGTGIDVDVGAWVVCNGVVYSNCVNHNIVSGGTLEFTAPCTIAGSASACFIQMSNQGKVLDTGGNAHTVSNDPNFGFAFIYLTDGSLAYFPSSSSFNGPATGTRWSIDESSFCDAQGVSFDTLFPGNVAGSYAPIEVRRGGTGQTQAGQFQGTATNDNAIAGNIGEFIPSTIASGSAVALTTNTAANVTSISLTAGDWDVWINGVMTGGATTTVNFIQASISTTSGTLSGVPGATQNTTICYGQTPFAYANHFVLNVGPARLSLAAPTTVYLVANASFATSTCSAYGAISARRRR